MIPSEIESEAHVHDSSISETFSITSESDSSFNNGEAETRRKLSKFRSIKLLKLPSMRLKSPNYMKTTSSSTAKKDNFQKLGKNLSRRSSFKPSRSLTRLPSTKLRIPLVRKSSGGSDLRKKMNKSRSIKLRNRPSVVLSHDEKLSNDQVQAITSSIRPLRVLKKMSSLRINRSSMKKNSQMLDTNINRATCSSTLKGSKLPNHLELQSGGSESQGISNIKVCPYTYCSLHGHSHSNLPPLKRFVSMRRRVLRTQKSVKLERQSSLRSKRSSNVKKGIRGRKMSGYGDPVVPETSNASKVHPSTRKMAGPRIREDNFEEISVNGEVYHEVNEEKSSSISICEQLEEESVACEEKNGDFFPKIDSESHYNARVDDKKEMGEQKHMGLWNLIYKHMVSGNAVEDEVQEPATASDKEEVEHEDTTPGTYNSGSSEFSRSSCEQHQENAIKLVKEAFDTILSEIPDQSPDDHRSNDSGSSPNEEFSEKNHDGEESSIPNSMAPEPEKTMLSTDTTNGVEVDKTESGIGSKSKQETPRKWSYLKKMIVLNRFVKALDKAKKFNPRKPRFLPVPSDPEAEKVHLRHQSLEEKKKYEEWMLDFALQQVISTLAPSQKRKVALLVQAFESVGPGPSSNLDVSSQAAQDESCVSLSKQKSSGKGEETYFGISLYKTSLPNKRSDENLDHINGSCTEENDPDNNIVNDDQPDSINLVQDAPKVNNVEKTLNGVLENGEEVSESEVHDVDLEFNDQKDVADTSNDVFSDRQFSVWEVRKLGLGFNDQLDIENTPNNVLPNREVSASEVRDPQFSEIPTEETDNITSSHEEISVTGEVNHEVNEESAACEETKGDYFPKMDPESDHNARVDDKMEKEEQKHMGLWRLIYKHMASGISVDDEVQEPATKTDKEEVEHGDTCPGTHESSSSDFSGNDHGLDVDNDHEQGIQIQLYQRNAIKLVKEAFDKILSEIPDQSPNDQSSDSGKEFAEKNHDGEKSSNLNSRKDSTAQEPEKNMLNTDIASGLEEEKTQAEKGSKSKQEAPRNWSYLKKMIVLNRFVKALDKAKKFNPRKPRFLPISSDPEAEKVHLRHQSLEEKKKSEEWMLDYALRQVISTLAPSQKRKVALLVQAFESVGPSPSSNLDREVSGSKVHDLDLGFDDQHDIANREVSGSEVHDLDLGLNDQHDVPNTSKDDVLANGEVYDSQVHDLGLRFNDQHDVANTESNGVLANGEVHDSEVHDLGSGFNDQYDVPNTSKDVLENGEVYDSQVHDLGSGFNDQHNVANTSNDVVVNGEVSASEVLDLDLGFNIQQLPSNYQINRRGEQSDDAQDSSTNGDVNSLVSSTELVEKSSKVPKGETVVRNKFLQLVTPQSPHEESKSSFNELTHEKQGNMGLWHLIYKHMVSGTTTLPDEAQGTINTGSQKVDFQQIEAIRMVEQAIDEIPLPDSQDDSPDHSITSDMIPEQEEIKNPPVRVSVSTEVDPKEPSQNSGGIEFAFGAKQQTKKSWSNLKKMILLRRFVTALEKVKRFNPREPRLLPLDSEKEAEKVLLRHQDMEGRKNGDEWMLDYALQQVVTKLTPARKRKVQLLVEAFETVIPT